MSELFSMEYFNGNLDTVVVASLYVMSKLLLVLIVYIILILVSELFYFFYCRVTHREFNFRVILEALTDIEFEE